MPRNRERDRPVHGPANPAANPPDMRAVAYDLKRKAVELRRAGKSWDDIAAECGWANRGTAYNMVKQAMIESRDLAYGEADLYREESLSRLLELFEAARPLALAGSDKHMIVCLRIIKQMGDLRGENMPIQVQIGEGDVDRALRELTEEFNRRAAAAAGSEAAGDPSFAPGDS